MIIRINASSLCGKKGIGSNNLNTIFDVESWPVINQLPVICTHRLQII